MSRPALLLLADGATYHGSGLGPDGVAEGEAVFFTGMTGYEEALTDPSYNGQLLIFCYPLIGNYGVDPAVRQHRRIVAAGVVCKRVTRHPSHWRSTGTVPDWLDEAGVRGIEGIDTRALVTRLREEGTMRAVLAVGERAVSDAPTALAAYVRKPLATGELVEAVSAKGAPARGSGPVRVALLDCGVKDNIANYLAAEGAVVLEVPYDTTFDEILALDVDGLLVSNGPGDPAELDKVVGTLRRAVAHRTMPTFGICLGHQLLALALGGRTFKMKYGHRGGNQPVQDVRTGSVIITAQNHGYAVDAASLPPDVEQTMINLNDGTNEGLRHRTLPVESVQFHPEASPGPGDARGVFKRFVDVMRRG
ncbi:MAG TPA: glutamine-hydrolyzing carbamoyl-phosphate synthase small subunit [Candidatus Eremiobacteraceae bacterium]|nr:glutamine-hydrolyzing carbamoyl-phosphate synthase small subunit [Candidatus Eremiobacteraceae bacterium]